MEIIFKNIAKTYGSKTVLDIKDLQFSQNECIGLVGNNGAGKTTMFRVLLDLIKPTSGAVLSNGFNVAENDQWKQYKASYLDEGFLIDFLAPEEYLHFCGSLYGLDKATVNERLKFFEPLFNDEILGQKGKYIRDLSKGNQKKVGIAAALLTQLPVVILDEPFANLDPSSQARLKKLFKDLRDQRNTLIIISSHELNHVAEICDRIVLVEKGQVVRDTPNSDTTLQELEQYFAVV